MRLGFSLSSPSGGGGGASVVAAAIAAAIICCFCNPSSHYTASAFSSGAGGCSGDRGSVESLHLSAPVTQEDTALSPLSVSFWTTDQTAADASPLAAGETFEAGVGYVLRLDAAAMGAEDFRGFLFRLANADDPTGSTLGLLEPRDGDTAAQVAGPCTTANLAGVTHTGSEEKQSADAIMLVDAPGSYNLQVTAVYQNSGGESRWAWESYDVVVADAPPPPPAETDAPAPPPPAAEPATEPPVTTLPPAPDEPPCSVCPPGMTVGNRDGRYPKIDFTCGQLEDLIANNAQLVCPVVERLSSWFQLSGFCECTGGYDDVTLPGVCTLCEGDESRVRDNVIVILPDNKNNAECPILFDLVQFVEDEERCPSAETEDACCRPAAAAGTPETDPPETDAPVPTDPPVAETPEAPAPTGDAQGVPGVSKEVSLQDGAATMKFVVFPEENEVEISLTRDGVGWIGFGVSPQGTMIGTAACIGLPVETAPPPSLYDITERSSAGIIPAPDDDQILTASSITTEDGKTTLTCRAPMDSTANFAVSSTGDTQFVWAYGDTIDSWSYHGPENRGTLDPMSLADDSGSSSTQGSGGNDSSAETGDTDPSQANSASTTRAYLMPSALALATTVVSVLCFSF